MDALNQQLENLLTSLGLSEKEISVYLALSKLDKASVSAISQAAGLNRTSSYHVLDRLTSLGLVKLIKGKTKEYYKIEPYDKIIFLAQKNLRVTKKRFTIANSIMPQLKSLYEKSSKS